jgi:hypothetical protein
MSSYAGHVRVPSVDRTARVLVAALACSGCHDVEHDVPPVVGEPCAGRDIVCADEDLVWCNRGAWTRFACDEICAPHVARGCLNDDEPAACDCDPASTSDEAPPPFACMDAETLVACDEAGCTPIACAELCAADLSHPNTLGCEDDACQCSAVGTACPGDAPPRCDGVFALLSCEAGIWAATDCRGHACAGTDAPICVVASDGTDACGCY